MPDRIGVLQDDLELLAWLGPDYSRLKSEDLALACKFSSPLYVDAPETARLGA